MTNTNELVVLTDGTRKMHIEKKGFLNFLTENGSEHLYDEMVLDREELTELFNLCIVNDNVPGFMVIGYYIDRDVKKEDMTPATMFVAIDEGRYDNYTYYAPIGQHSEGDKEYIKECTPITKEEYIERSKHLYTPKAYL